MSKSEDMKAARIKVLMEDSAYKFVYFKGGNLMSGPGTKGFTAFDNRIFGRLAQSLMTGISESMIKDFAKTVQTMAEDWSVHDHLIGFGEQVWDMRTLTMTDTSAQYVYSSSITPHRDTAAAQEFLLQLAKGDPELAKDYAQALAPVFMYRKPSGVVWFVGDGANGKSSLIEALYRIIGKHFTSLTTSAIEDGRATPSLAGVLGNICREASEARVEDSERYKAIGTHEPFSVREYFTQNMLTIDTNFHTIFNANNVPVFGDKTKGARRRTLVVPFNAHFRDNPTFEDKTFTPAFLGGLLQLILDEAVAIRDRGYKYEWSQATLDAKDAYDNDVNSSEAYLEDLIGSGVAGFSNYNLLRFNYEAWCSSRGLIPLGITQLKRTIQNHVNPRRVVTRISGMNTAKYVFADHLGKELIWLDNGYGMIDKSKVLKQGELGGSW